MNIIYQKKRKKNQKMNNNKQFDLTFNTIIKF